MKKTLILLSGIAVLFGFALVGCDGGFVNNPRAVAPEAAPAGAPIVVTVGGAGVAAATPGAGVLAGNTLTIDHDGTGLAVITLTATSTAAGALTWGPSSPPTSVTSLPSTNVLTITVPADHAGGTFTVTVSGDGSASRAIGVTIVDNS